MRVLFAWEMGRNFGHITQILPVAEALARRGLKVDLALRNPAAMSQFGGSTDFRVVQAPYRSPGKPQPGEAPPPVLLYSDDLLHCGYNDASSLATLMSEWESLFEQLQPDVIVAQAAPTALLVSHGKKYRRFTLGRGYDIPPATSPQRPLRHWETGDPLELASREARILSTINAALQIRGREPLTTFCDFLKVEKTFLCALKETDHYPDRGRVPYYGSPATSDSGTELMWAPGAVQRIFAYIRPEKKVSIPVIQALLRLPANIDIIVAAPGVNDSVLKGLKRPGVRIISGPVRLDPLLPHCDLLISHASSGICNTALRAGIPLLMFPNHIEQLMQARAIARQGAGLGVAGGMSPDGVLQAIGRVLREPHFRNAARAIQEKYRDLDPDQVADRIAAEIIGTVVT